MAKRGRRDITYRCAAGFSCTACPALANARLRWECCTDKRFLSLDHEIKKQKGSMLDPSVICLSKINSSSKLRRFMLITRYICWSHHNWNHTWQRTLRRTDSTRHSSCELSHNCPQSQALMPAVAVNLVCSPPPPRNLVRGKFSFT